MGRPAFWTEEKIINSIKDFIKEYGRVPKSKEIDKIIGLPKRLTITNKFGITYDKFIELYFTEYYHRCNSLKYSQYSIEQLVEDFKQQYIRMNYPRMDYYDQHRRKGSPCAQHLSKLMNMTYNELLQYCGFKIKGYNIYSKVKKEKEDVQFDISVLGNHDFDVEYITELINNIIEDS